MISLRHKLELHSYCELCYKLSRAQGWQRRRRRRRCSRGSTRRCSEKPPVSNCPPRLGAQTQPSQRTCSAPPPSSSASRSPPQPDPHPHRESVARTLATKAAMEQFPDGAYGLTCGCRAACSDRRAPRSRRGRAGRGLPLPGLAPRPWVDERGMEAASDPARRRRLHRRPPPIHGAAYGRYLAVAASPAHRVDCDDHRNVDGGPHPVDGRRQAGRRLRRRASCLVPPPPGQRQVLLPSTASVPLEQRRLRRRRCQP